jgi:hypothetical protein
MFTKFATTNLAKKVVGAAVICGVLALGPGGVAFATTTTPTGAHATATPTKCARADRALTRINRVEAAIGRRIPKLQTAEQKATAAGDTTLATRIGNRITRLQKIDTRIGTLAQKIEARCPSATPGTSGSTT